MLTVFYHQTRTTKFSLGKPKGKGDDFTAADSIYIKMDNNYIRDPAVAKLLQENKSFQESLAATAAARARGHVPKGCEIISDTFAKAKEMEPAVITANPWASIAPDELKTQVENTSDLVQLLAMQEAETRAEIQAALTKRIAEVRAGGANEDDSEGGEVTLNQTN